MKYIHLSNTNKNYIPTKTCHLLHVVCGFAYILDGLITVFSFGYLTSDFSTTMITILMKRRSEYCVCLRKLSR